MIEEKEEVRKWYHKLKDMKVITSIVVIVVILAVFYGVGNRTAKADIEGERVTYEGLLDRIQEGNAEIHQLNEDIESKNEEIDQVDGDLNDIQEEYDAALEVIDNKKSIEEEIEELKGEIDSKKSEIEDLNTQIKDKEKELSSVTGEVKEAKGKPITLSAGFFTVGKDLPVGRYKVTPNGNGNFFVNQGMSVNIMLGNGEYYESEYVFEAYDGDQIELTLSATFTPVE